MATYPRESTARSVLRNVLIVVAVAITLYLLYLVRKPLGWIIIATFLAIAMSGPVNFLHRHLGRRGIAIGLSYVGLLLIPIGLGAIIVPPVVTGANDLANDAPRYAADVQRFVQRNKTLRGLEDDYGVVTKVEQEARKLPNRSHPRERCLFIGDERSYDRLRAIFDRHDLPANLVGTGLCVALWGYFLYQGVVDPLGGINTLWQLFGVGNQMLAGIALLLCTSVLVKMKRERYVWVTLAPTAWLLITTLTAGVQKIFDPDPKIGFLSLARKFSDAAAQGTVLAPAKSIAEMQRVAFNNYLDAVVCAFFVLLVVAMCIFAVKICMQALKQANPTAHEIPPLAGTQGALA